jgi:hypothetical protein
VTISTTLNFSTRTLLHEFSYLLCKTSEEFYIYIYETHIHYVYTYICYSDEVRIIAVMISISYTA